MFIELKTMYLYEFFRHYGLFQPSLPIINSVQISAEE